MFPKLHKPNNEGLASVFSPITGYKEVDGVVVHSLGFSAEGSGFESRPGPSESMKLFSSNKLIPSTQNSTNVNSHELHL
jgi:hypothetical protein